MDGLMQVAFKLFEAVIGRTIGLAGSLGRLGIPGERAGKPSGVNC
jgi:hypothetical protein